MKEINGVWYTQSISFLVLNYTRGNKQLAEQYIMAMAEGIKKLKKTKFKIDSGDNSLKLNGVPISFIRDHGNGIIN